jgi:Inosine-uridine preferring nucleoside hydrolase
VTSRRPAGLTPRHWCLPRSLAAVVLVGAALVACTPSYDDDGDAGEGELATAPAKSPDARRTVVDTDLGGEDLVALAFLLRHPAVRVEAVTIAAAGLVRCDPGVDIVADLFTALEAEPVPIACGRAAAELGPTVFPETWREASAAGLGLERSPSTQSAVPESAPDLIGQLALEHEKLVVVALGPLTNLADLAAESPQAYGRLGGVHALAGSVDGPVVDGLAELNAAADLEAFDVVLAGAAPVTLVAVDAVPEGTPVALHHAPVAGRFAVTVGPDLPWWDLAAAVAFVAPQAVELDKGDWAPEPAVPGRLVRSGDGSVRVAVDLDPSVIEAETASVFAAE